MECNSKHFFLTYLQNSADLGWSQLSLPIHLWFSWLDYVCGWLYSTYFPSSPGIMAMAKGNVQAVIYSKIPLVKASYMAEPRDRV